MAYGMYGPDRHECHCGKSFLRKEHLRRHQATHEERSFTCYICDRAFTRNDLLRRHVALHTSSPMPSNRNGRACDACHENKTRCDGGDQCTLCMKRSIACTYDRPSGPPDRTSKKPKLATTSTHPRDRHAVQRLGDTNLAVGPVVETTGPSAAPANMASAKLLADAQKTQSSVEGEQSHNQESDACCARICFRSIMKAVDLPFLKNYERETIPSTTALNAWISACLETYLGTFHERWNIIHAPSFDVKADDTIKVGTMIMIGAWLRDRENLGELILDIFNRLVPRLLSLLLVPIASTTDKPWPLDLYQSCLLQIIFAFETGMPKLIQRGRQLLAPLIVALRAHGAFNPVILKQHGNRHFPGDFKPWVHGLSEFWKLLAYYILKIDVSMSLLLNQAPLLSAEELELSIPSTFALNNAHGINRFFERHPQEPRDRETIPMMEIAANPSAIIPSGFLFQDIQLGLLGLFGSLHRWTQRRRFRDVDITTHCCQDRELQAQLNTWHDRLEGICRLWQDPIANGDAIRTMMITHMGRETFEDDEWEKHVSERISRTFYNVSVLHGILSLYLLTDTRWILFYSTEAWDIGRRLEKPAPDPELETKLRHWASTWQGRRALIESLHILKQYTSAPFPLPEQTMDPIAHLAVTMASLTLRCWIRNNTEMCQCGIVPGQAFDALRLELEAEKEQWAEAGGIVVLEGMPLCHCALEMWESRCADALEGRAKTWESSQVALAVLRGHGKSRPTDSSPDRAE